MNNKIKRLYTNKIYYFLILGLNRIFTSFKNKIYDTDCRFKIGTYTIKVKLEYLPKIYKILVDRVSFEVDIFTKEKVFFHWQHIINVDDKIDNLSFQVDLCLKESKIFSENFENYEEVLPFIKKIFKGKFASLSRTIKTIIKYEMNKEYSFEEIRSLFFKNKKNIDIDDFCVFFKEKYRLPVKDIYKYNCFDFNVEKENYFLGIYSSEKLFPKINDSFTLKNDIVEIEELKCLFLKKELYKELEKIKIKKPQWSIKKIFENLLLYLDINLLDNNSILADEQREIYKLYSEIDFMDIEQNLFERKEVFSDVKVNISKYVWLVEFANNFNFKINNFSTKQTTFNKEKLLKEIFDTFIITIKEKKNMNIEDLEKWIEEENQDLDKSMFNGITKELKEYLKTLKN
jgi:hypothetical protein